MQVLLSHHYFYVANGNAYLTRWGVWRASWNRLTFFFPLCDFSIHVVLINFFSFSFAKCSKAICIRAHYKLDLFNAMLISWLFNFTSLYV